MICTDRRRLECALYERSSWWNLWKEWVAARKGARADLGAGQRGHDLSSQENIDRLVRPWRGSSKSAFVESRCKSWIRIRRRHHQCWSYWSYSFETLRPLEKWESSEDIEPVLRFRYRIVLATTVVFHEKRSEHNIVARIQNLIWDRPMSWKEQFPGS